MRAFVTGASGYIGSAVACTLARAGHEVLGLVRTPGKSRSLAAQGVEPLVGDMSAPDGWRTRAATCEVRIHCAAEYSARYREFDRATAQELARLPAPEGSVPLLIYTSGVWIYGDTGGKRVDERAQLSPSAFLAPRLEVEQLVTSANARALRTLIVRPGCVYGGSGSLTAAWFESAVKNQAAHFVGSGEQRWAMVHLDDLSDLYLRAAQSALHGEVFNVVDTSKSTVLECAAAASRAAGAGGNTVPTSIEQARKTLGPMADCLRFDQRVSSAKAQRLLGWCPRQRSFVEQAPTLFRAWQASTAG